VPRCSLRARGGSSPCSRPKPGAARGCARLPVPAPSGAALALRCAPCRVGGVGTKGVPPQRRPRGPAGSGVEQRADKREGDPLDSPPSCPAADMGQEAAQEAAEAALGVGGHPSTSGRLEGPLRASEWLGPLLGCPACGLVPVPGDVELWYPRRRGRTMTQRRSSTPTRSRRHGLDWTHPGETVAEEMAARGLAAAGFAAELGCTAAELDGLLPRRCWSRPLWPQRWSGCGAPRRGSGCVCRPTTTRPGTPRGPGVCLAPCGRGDLGSCGASEWKTEYMLRRSPFACSLKRATATWRA
jgi:hypothetical protein